MIHLVFIVFCVAAGFAVRMARMIPADAYKGVNVWILYVALPACFLRYIPYIRWDKEVLLPSLSPVLIWMGGWLFATLYGRWMNSGNHTVGSLKLTGGLSNTAFLGFIAVYYGERQVGIAVLYDQMSFVLLATIGLITALRASARERLSVPALLKRMLRFPPFIVCMIALALPKQADISFLNPLLDKIAGTIGAMALFSMGLQLDFRQWGAQWKNVSAGLLYKLFLAPGLVLLLVLVMGLKGMVPRISVFEAAMPTLATAGVLADEYGLNPPLSNLMVSASILLSFVTMGCWWWILERVISL
ncbi:MAG: AEC family transporter [Bacteroidetes bacterium]|nr:AEC family transporter [Bacteroidota bacterium]